MKKLLTISAALLLFGSMTVVQADTYTVAGDNTTILGSEWASDNTDNDMTLSDGLYVFAKEVNFSSNTNINFKVCKDHGWSTAYPASNYFYTVPAGAKYLIITMTNDNNHSVNAFAISSMTVAGEPEALFGTSSTWSPSTAANDMSLQSDGTYKFEKTGVALTAGKVKFKACANHSWDNAWPSSNYELNIPESGNYTITITFDPATLSVSATADLEQAVVVIPTIKMYGNFNGASWADTEEFSLAANEETASLTLTGLTKGDYMFGVKIDGTWTTNGSQFTRTNNSYAITAGTGNCSFNTDRNGDYTFTWTYATNTLSVTYPPIPAQSVAFDGLASQILKGTTINLEEKVTSSGIDNPGYLFYIREKNGNYGSAVEANYTFNALGEYVVKVEALEDNTGEPVAGDETNVVVYDAKTFTNGSTIYVDFTAMTDGAKGVNYPFDDKKSELAYDAAGASTIKEVVFTADVEWTTNDVFIKTEKAGWSEQKFIVPEDGLNVAKVASDGASYIWQAPTYTVAGIEAVFGTEWDATNTDNDMTPEGGVYKWEKTDITLPEGNVTFKVALNHNWSIAWPETNYNLTIEEAGIYTIAITYNPATKVVAAEKTKTGEAVVVNTAGILGSWDEWAATEALAGEESASLKKHLEAGNYEFKIVVNGSDYRSNGYTYHRGYTETEGITTEGGNMKLTADIPGDYTFTWTFATNAISIEFPITPIAPIGGKFIINTKGDTAVFSRGNLQYQQSSDTWRCAPNQYDWKGNDNLQMGNTAYEGWVDLFCWSIGSENNYGATSAYLTTDYFNKDFVDWGGLFSGTWSTVSINEGYYLLYTRPNANNLWGVAMIGDNLGMILLPDQWTAPSGITFVPGTIPTTDMWYDDDCMDPTKADQDHWRLNPNNLPANKFTLDEWADLEAAGAVFCPYAGRRSGGYGNHTNRDDETVAYEYAFTYWENYYGAYWTSTVRYPEQGKVYWLPMICGGCNDQTENWGRGSHGWWENGRYGHSVRLVTIKPRQYTVTYDANGAEGTVPTDAAKYLDGAQVSLANADDLSKEGYVFAGWKFKGATYNAGAAYTIAGVLANEEIVFEAQWEKAWQVVRTGLVENRHYTVCLQKNIIEIEGATFWNLTYKNEGNTEVYLVEETAPEAGKPYIIQATAATLRVVYGKTTAAAPVENGALRGTFVDLNAEAFAALTGNIYLLINDAIRPRTTGNYLNANRAYIDYDALTVPQTSNFAPGKRIRAIPMQPQVATGMEELNASETPVKVMLNGQLYILRGEKLYDATGRMVK